jgi:hypothetical protein
VGRRGSPACGWPAPIAGLRAWGGRALPAGRRAWGALALLALAAGCGAAASPAQIPPTRPRPAARGLPSDVSQCLRLKDPAAGVPAYTSDGARLPFDVHAGHEPGTTPRCGPGELRVLRLEELAVGGRATYVRRGGCQTPCVARQATVHVPAAAFAAPARLLGLAARRGDGAPVSGCRAVVRAAPQRAGRELARMFYKRPSETAPAVPTGGDVGARWSNYGDPGAVYRGRGGLAAVDYSYVLWNPPRTARGVLHGGGIVRAVIARGQAIRLCPAGRLTLPAFDAAGRLDGHVALAYAELAPPGGAVVYGWVMVAYSYDGHPVRRLTT